MIMTGYEGPKTYRLCNPYTNKVVVMRDVVFEEENSWKWSPEELVHLDGFFTVNYGNYEHANKKDQPETRGDSSRAGEANCDAGVTSVGIVTTARQAPEGAAGASQGEAQTGSTAQQAGQAARAL